MHHSELNEVIGLMRPALYNATSSDHVKCFKWKQWHYSIFPFQLHTILNPKMYSVTILQVKESNMVLL